MGNSKSINLKDMKRMNKATALMTLWKSGELSRSELSEKTGLSPATISLLTEKFLRDKVIIEVGAKESTGGRKPVMLKINPYGGYICTINVSKHNIHYSILNMNLESVEEFVVLNTETVIVQHLYERVVKNINLLLSKANIAKDSLIGIGISIPKEYDDIDKKVLFNTGISVEMVNIDEALNFKYKVPVFIEHNINAMAIAEYHLGVARYMHGFVYIDIGEEIKATVIENGEVLKKPVYQYSDMGHMIIDRNGPRCVCGRKGCLQVFTSIPAIIKKVLVSIAEGNNTDLDKSVNGDLKKVNFEFIVKKANEGDGSIREIIRDVAEALCIGILNFSSMLNIKNIVVGGKIRKIKCFSEQLDEAVEKYYLSENNRLNVVVASLPQEFINIGNGAVVIGSHLKNI